MIPLTVGMFLGLAGVQRFHDTLLVSRFVPVFQGFSRLPITSDYTFPRCSRKMRGDFIGVSR